MKGKPKTKMSNIETLHRAFIQKRAEALAYDLVGFSDLELSSKDRHNITEFYKDNLNTDLSWFGRYLKLRLFPKEILAEAKGAIVLGLYYRKQNSEASIKQGKVRIARYAQGKDYHKVMRKKAKQLVKLLKIDLPHLKARICVDSAPIPEKILGRMAGLGWQGKNTNLIHPKLGSYFFLSVIVVNLHFSTGEIISDQCRDCRLCIDACPTQALEGTSPYGINAKKCISYLTIEHKGTMAEEQQAAISKSNWAFGCDICQEVCPYNRNPKARGLNSQEIQFDPVATENRIPQLMLTGKAPAETEWREWSQASPLARVTHKKLEQNLALASTQTK